MKYLPIFLLLLTSLVGPLTTLAQDASALVWTLGPALPAGAEAACVGRVGARLVVAGERSVHARGGAGGWQEVARLPFPLGARAAVPVGEGLMCLGAGGGVRMVPEGAGGVRVEPLPPLPEPTVAAAAVGPVLYALGRDGRLRRLDLPDLGAVAPRAPASWRPVGARVDVGRPGDRLVAQQGAEHVELFLLRRAPTPALYRLQAEGAAWGRRAAPPFEPEAAAAYGVASVVALGGGGAVRYHTMTDRWTAAGALPATGVAAAVPTADGLLLVGREGEGGGRLWEGAWRSGVSGRFQAADYGVLVLYLTLLTGMGFYFARRERTAGDFFLGGRRIPAWAAGLSIMATQVSSIGFMALPAKVFATDWAYFAGVFTWFIVVPIVAYAYVPFFRRLDVTSAYEYLEARLGVGARLFAAVLYCLLQVVGRLGVVLYLPALALSAVTGIDVALSIGLMGVLATLYTVLGGMEAVVWTDVVQAVVLLGGAVLCVGVSVMGLDGGLAEFFALATADDKFAQAPNAWDPTMAVLWVIVVGNVFNRLSTLTSDQSTVQRYLTTPDERSAKQALWAHVAASIPWAVIIYVLGTALYVFYKSRPEALDPTVATDGLVPLFMAQQLPVGISGLVIAGLFAAAMSSLDSAMHSTATVIVTDFYGRFAKGATEARRLTLARWLTGGLGLFGTGIALLMAQQEVVSMQDFFIGITGLFAGSAAGLFALGLFTRRANGTGALVGAAASAAALYLVQTYTALSFFLYGAVGFLVCLAVGYLASLAIGGPPRADGLTVYDLRRTAAQTPART